MAQFDIYHNPDPETRHKIPYLLDVQSNLLEQLSTRTVIPLVVASKMGKVAKKLNPKFEIEKVAVAMSTAEIAAVSNSILVEKVASLQEQREDIIAALELLFTGI